MNTDFARRQMVAQQVRARDVYDASVLSVMEKLLREQFAPPELTHLAYADTELPLAHGQAMMTPFVEGRLLQALELNHDHCVLEIGTGTGYLTACLARLAGSVCSIDLYQDFVDQAANRLHDVGIHNVTIECLDAMASLPKGQFDAIAVTGSIARPDSRFVAALKPGGRMFVVVGNSPVMAAQLVTRGNGSQWQSTSLFETALAPLVNSATTSLFSF